MRRPVAWLPLALSIAALFAPRSSRAESPDSRIAARLAQLEKDRRTIAHKEIHLIALAVESYGVDHNAYPKPAAEFVSTRLLGPALKAYLPSVPARDPWGSDYLYLSSGQGYVIVSFAADTSSDFSYQTLAKEGLAAVQRAACTGATEGAGADLVFSDGIICRWVGEKPLDPWK